MNLTKPALVVSIHDVTPEFSPQLKMIIDNLRGSGVSGLVLKVVPYFAGRANILRFPSFISWLEELASSGCEIVLHGLFHARSEEGKRRKPSLKNWLTRGEDEFSALSEAEARERLLQGLGILEEAGLKCSGFTAPTWRLSRLALKAIKEAGFSYLTTFWGIIDFAHKRRFFSPAFGHQGIDNFLESLMSLGNSLGKIFIVPFLKLIRIIFHPRQIDHANFQKSLKLVSELLPITETMTYSRFLTR